MEVPEGGGETRELRHLGGAALSPSFNFFFVSGAWTMISYFSNTLDLAQSA
jgi:hypothetical protein